MFLFFQYHYVGVFKIFNIVCFQCNHSIMHITNDIVSSGSQQTSLVNFFHSKELEKYCCSKIIHIFIIYMKDSFNNSLHFINRIRTQKQNNYTPILFIYSKEETNTILTNQIKFCEFISFPISEEGIKKISSLFHYTYQYHLHNNTYSSKLKYMHLNLSKKYFKIPICDILFIETREHKCILHTVKEEIPVPFTLNKLLELSQGSTLTQSHRSFVVNLENIQQIDKSQDPWIVKFKNYKKYAFVSRSFKKDLLKKYLCQ